MTRKDYLTRDFSQFAQKHRGGDEIFLDYDEFKVYCITKAWQMISNMSARQRARYLKMIAPIDTGESTTKDPYRRNVNPEIPLICLRHNDGTIQVIDGNHRSYQAYLEVWSQIPAFIFSTKTAQKFECSDEETEMLLFEGEEI